MDAIEGLARLLCRAEGVEPSAQVTPGGKRQWHLRRDTAENLISRSAVELCVGLAEAGVLTRTEEALIHYSYGVNSGTLTAPNTPQAISDKVEWYERLTMGRINVDKIEVRTRFEHVTDWRPRREPPPA